MMYLWEHTLSLYLSMMFMLKASTMSRKKKKE